MIRPHQLVEVVESPFDFLEAGVPLVGLQMYFVLCFQFADQVVDSFFAGPHGLKERSCVIFSNHVACTAGTCGGCGGVKVILNARDFCSRFNSSADGTGMSCIDNCRSYESRGIGVRRCHGDLGGGEA